MPVEVVDLPLDPDGPQLGDDGVVIIEWGAVQTARGWRPTVWLHGQLPIQTFRMASREDAMRSAEAHARSMAARYVGDWTIAIGPREEAG